MKQIIDKDWIQKLIRNKFFITGVAFLIWISFFDPNNLLGRYKSLQQLHRLEKDKEYYIQSIEEDKQRLEELQSDKDNLEKFAREQFLMKKENEEIIIVVEED